MPGMARFSGNIDAQRYGKRASAASNVPGDAIIHAMSIRYAWIVCRIFLHYAPIRSGCAP